LRSNSFSQKHRIRKRSEFTELIKYGKTISDRYFFVNYKDGKYGESRIGLTVSKKTGGAVRRNRIKRFCREFFRKNRKILRGSWDINIVAKKDAAEITQQTTDASLKRLFEKISETHN